MYMLSAELGLETQMSPLGPEKAWAWALSGFPCALPEPSWALKAPGPFMGLAYTAYTACTLYIYKYKIGPAD